MKVSIGVGGAASGRRRDFDEQVEYVVESGTARTDAVRRVYGTSVEARE